MADPEIAKLDYEMMWIDLKLNLNGTALMEILKGDKEQSEVLRKIAEYMEGMERDEKYQMGINEGICPKCKIGMELSPDKDEWLCHKCLKYYRAKGRN